jgi:Polyketide cyclase / dehydrase and lipid transport
MASRSRHVSEWINRPAAEVYAYARDPAHLVHWAQGLGGSVEQVGGEWFMDSPGGRIRVAFAAPNAFGVLDHEVTTPDGDVVHVPMRVTPDGDGCEVVFTVRRLPGMTDEDLGRDVGLVATDLATLKAVLEARALPD